MTRFVVALRAEARPLVERLRLAGVEAPNPFPLYRHRRNGVWLVVSGVGKAWAAAAAAFLHMASGAVPNRPWLNVGVGGHARKPVGEGILASKVVDEGSGLAWYPPRPFALPVPGAEVRTVDRPERLYAEDAVYEMEASGFLQAAGRFSTAELVHCLKVVSDNLEEPVERFTAKLAEECVAGQLDVVEALAGELGELAGELEAAHADPPGYAEMLGRWRFSVTQRRQLRRLLQRRAVLELPGSCDIIAGAVSSREALKRLGEWIEEGSLRTRF